jgi:4-hydroxyphenylpyruvate dioxygenase
MNDWTEFYRELFAFVPVPDDQRFGILPGGRILCSPCRSFYLQIIEPEPSAPELHGDERLARVGLGTPDVIEATRALRGRGVEFVDADARRPAERGALTRGLHAGVLFELVRDQRTLSGRP